MNTDRQDDEFEGFLRQFHLREPGPLPEIKPSHDVPRRRWWKAWTAAAVIATVVAVVALLPARRSPTFKGSDALAVMQSSGERIESGKVVRSSAAAGDVLALVDSSSIEMRAQSELSLERVADGVLVHLNGGSVIVSAALQRAGHLYVETKDLRVSVVGTVFLVNAEKSGSRVFVIHGEVQVRQGEIVRNLLPGEQVATAPAMPPLPLIEQIAWSRNASAHLALLQQVAVAAPTLPLPQ